MIRKPLAGVPLQTGGKPVRPRRIGLLMLHVILV